MPINKYCWRCGMVIPMLTDEEWKIVHPTISTSRMMEMVKKHKVGLDEASRLVCDKYIEITGFKETNANAIWHHIASQYGPDCTKCGKPYRTPQARYCAECGDGIENIKSA